MSKKLTAGQRLAFRDLCTELPAIKERLFRVGLYKTGHAMDMAVKSIGWEVADLLKTDLAGALWCPDPHLNPPSVLVTILRETKFKFHVRVERTKTIRGRTYTKGDIHIVSKIYVKVRT